jgi:hypothetical protein
MRPRTAIFYSENPLAIVRDFPNEVDRAQALTAIELGGGSWTRSRRPL